MVKRAANWKKWSLIPHAKIWEIVALSLDIEPRQVNVKFADWTAASIAGKPRFYEFQEFMDRLDVLIANVEKNTLLSRTGYGDGFPETWELCISNVGIWAESVGWNLPQDFPKIVKKDIKQSNTEINQNKSDALAALNQASLIFWSKVDPNDPATHPENSQVSEWLMKKGFSSSLASKGATIIRPEWAAIGRKPNK